MHRVTMCCRRAACMTLLAGAVTSALAQSFPIKPIRIITAQTGGATDLAVRQVAHGLTSAVSQQVIVDNRGGAAGGVAAIAVLKTGLACLPVVMELNAAEEIAGLLTGGLLLLALTGGVAFRMVPRLRRSRGARSPTPPPSK